MADAMADHVGNLDYTSGPYQEMLRRAQESGKCPMCGPEVLDDPNYPPLDEEGDWILRERSKGPGFESPDRAGNEVPLYLMIIRRTHGEVLSDADWVAVGRLFQRAQEKFQIPGGGLCMRFGGTIGGRTIFHPHFHLTQPNLDPVKTAEMGFDKAVPWDFPIHLGTDEDGQPRSVPWDFPVG